MSEPRGPTAQLTALSVSDVVKVLSRASGRQFSEEIVRADLESGAPANADGSINLVHYAAWLVRSLADGS
jgi:hypothetical protein